MTTPLSIEEALIEVEGIKEKRRIAACHDAVACAFRQAWFDICPIQRLDGDKRLTATEWSLLHDLHCVNFSMMSSGLRATVKLLAQKAVGIEPVVEEESVPVARKSWFRWGK